MVPLGRLARPLPRGESLGAGSAERLRALWRLALAAQALGAMRAAFELTLDYVKRRRQFGRAIGSFQALQHRLSECFILLEGGRWLTYECAARDAPPEASALAAAHVLTSADRVFREMHQFSGAMGFTNDHQLHLWTMPLQALRLELGGCAAHARAAAALRWSACAAPGATTR
jgi:alkylation response protein AidB-like acyl-CoA dehydrogenase